MSYKADSNNPKKSAPTALPASAFGKALQPTAVTINERCDNVIIHADSGSCFLLYNTTASIGSALDTADGVDSVTKFTKQVGATEIGGKVFQTLESGSVTPQIINLPVGAVAFSGSDGFDATMVTFVYRGGL